MKHIVQINSEFIKFAKKWQIGDAIPDWWTQMSPNERMNYKSKFKNSLLPLNAPIKYDYQTWDGSFKNTWAEDELATIRTPEYFDAIEKTKKQHANKTIYRSKRHKMKNVMYALRLNLAEELITILENIQKTVGLKTVPEKDKQNLQDIKTKLQNFVDKHENKVRDYVIIQKLKQFTSDKLKSNLAGPFGDFFTLAKLAKKHFSDFKKYKSY